MLVSLVQGAASFVAGQVAKTGDMKVGTPVATIGIRGTAVILDISAADGKVSISVVDQHDGRVHTVQVFNNAGVLLRNVTSNGPTLTITPTASLEIVISESAKTPAQAAQEFNAFQQALGTYDAYKAIAPNTPPPADERRADANPQSNQHANSSAHPDQAPPPGNLDETSSVRTLVGTTTTTDTRSRSTSNAASQPQSVKVVVATAPSQDDNTPLVFTEPKAPPPIVSIPSVVAAPQLAQVSSGAGDHTGPVMSADGRFVTYDPDGSIFLYDRQSNTTTTIAAAGNGFTYSAPTISLNGDFIVFQGSNGSQSYVFVYDNNPADPNYHHITQLAPGSSPAVDGDGGLIAVENGGSSIAVYNQAAQLVASITPAAVGSNGTIWKPAISGDGHLVAFWVANAAAPGGSGELFTYNLSTGTVVPIASTTTGAGSGAASLSADGHYLVYQSDAASAQTEIFLVDLISNKVVFSTIGANGASYNPVISPDGHFIVFATDAKFSNNDTNSFANTYIVDVTDPSHPIYKLASVLQDGTQGNAASDLGAAISAGGLFIAFGSNASNFSTSGTGGSANVFVVDPNSGRTTIVQESANSPALLTTNGTIKLTGDTNGVALSVSDTSGKFSAAFELEWQYSVEFFRAEIRFYRSAARTNLQLSNSQSR